MARNLAADIAADRAQVLETFAVSRETTARLDRFCRAAADIAVVGRVRFNL
jgi:hypothetical protein